jgi:SHS2 domain-containing protein
MAKRSRAGMFEMLEHTADIGFRARGQTLAEMFECAAEALVATALEIDDVRPAERHAIEARGEDLEALLVSWLSEVLYLLDGKCIALGGFEVTEIAGGRVVGAAMGEPRDPTRHRPRLGVKGVTYHQLKIAQDDNGWWAEVFLDV